MSPDNHRWEEHWRDTLNEHSPTPLPADWEAMENVLSSGQQAPPDPAPKGGAGGGLSLWSGALLTGLVALGIGLGYANWPSAEQVAQGVQHSNSPQRSRYDTLYSVDPKGKLVIASIDTTVRVSLPSAVPIDQKKPSRPEVSPPKPGLINDTSMEGSLRQEVVPKNDGASTSSGLPSPPSPPRSKGILPLPPARSSLPSDQELWQRRMKVLIASPDFKVRPYRNNNGYFPPIRSKFNPE